MEQETALGALVARYRAYGRTKGGTLVLLRRSGRVGRGKRRPLLFTPRYSVVMLLLRALRKRHAPKEVFSSPPCCRP